MTMKLTYTIVVHRISGGATTGQTIFTNVSMGKVFKEPEKFKFT
jgi:hypothetical protein